MRGSGGGVGKVLTFPWDSSVILLGLGCTDSAWGRERTSSQYGCRIENTGNTIKLLPLQPDVKHIYKVASSVVLLYFAAGVVNLFVLEPAQNTRESLNWCCARDGAWNSNLRIFFVTFSFRAFSSVPLSKCSARGWVAKLQRNQLDEKCTPSITLSQSCQIFWNTLNWISGAAFLLFSAPFETSSFLSFIAPFSRNAAIKRSQIRNFSSRVTKICIRSNTMYGHVLWCNCINWTAFSSSTHYCTFWRIPLRTRPSDPAESPARSPVSTEGRWPREWCEQPPPEGNSLIQPPTASFLN